MQHQLAKSYQSDNPVAAAAAESTPGYYVDFSAIYFIWFSRDRSSFMPIRHRIAIENLRKAKNSDELKLMLVYAERLLDQPAQEKLVNFCVLHQIKLIEVHSLEAGCSDCPVESELFQNLLLELYDPNGNAAAASDICRVLSDTILQGNTYVDCDDIKELNVQMLKRHALEIADDSVKAGHILGNIRILDPENIFRANNNIIAFVRCADTSETKKVVRSGFSAVQINILDAYRDPNRIFFNRAIQSSSLIKLFLNQSERVAYGEQGITFSNVFAIRDFLKNHLSLKNYTELQLSLDDSAMVSDALHSSVHTMYEIGKRFPLGGLENLMQAFYNLYHDKKTQNDLGQLLNVPERMFSDMIEVFFKFSVILFSGPNALLAAVECAGPDHGRLHSLQYYSLASAFSQDPSRCTLRTTRASINNTAKNELSWMDSYAIKHESEEARQIQVNILFKYHAQTLYKGKRPPTPELHTAIEANVPEEIPYIEKLKLA